MYKNLLIPFLVLMFVGAAVQAQFISPDEDIVGFVDFYFDGGASVEDGFLEGDFFLLPIDGDLDDVDLFGFYNWHLEVGLEYAFDSNAGSGGDFLYETLDLGKTTLDSVLEYLLTGPPSGDYETVADILNLDHGVPGFADLEWPEPLGIAPEDFFVFVDSEDSESIYIDYFSETVDPELIGDLIFEGAARLSAKSAGGAAVPEPSTYGLLGATFLVVLVAVRRRNMSVRV